MPTFIRARPRVRQLSFGDQSMWSHSRVALAGCAWCLVTPSLLAILVQSSRTILKSPCICVFFHLALQVGAAMGDARESALVVLRGDIKTNNDELVELRAERKALKDERIMLQAQPPTEQTQARLAQIAEDFEMNRDSISTTVKFLTAMTEKETELLKATEGAPGTCLLENNHLALRLQACAPCAWEVPTC